MSDFTVSKQLENYQYIEKCPIFITGGNLLKNTKTNDMLIHIRFKSLSPKCINAVIFDVDCFDIEDEALEGITRFQLLDLNIKSGETFGDKEPIKCPNKYTRKCHIVIKKVIFSDDTKWEFSDNDTEITFGLQTRISNSPLANLMPILKNEMKSLNYQTNNITYVPAKYNDYWICTCGAINHYNINCCVCQAEKYKLFSIFDSQYLKKREEEYQQKLKDEEQERNRRRMIAEQIREEERRHQREIELKKLQLMDREEEERERKIKKTLYITLAVVAVVVILAFFYYAASGGFDTDKNSYNDSSYETEYYDDYNYEYSDPTTHFIDGTAYPVDTTYLNLRSKNLTDNDIQDLCYFTNLETLILSDNRISDISCLSELTSLKELDLNNNRIENISALENMKHLQDLNLTNNQISDISPLKQLEEMKILGLGYNQVVNTYALKNMNSLEEVDLNNNELVSISGLKGKTNLKKLYLNDNKSIESFTLLTSCSSLEVLNITNTRCSDENIEIIKNAIPNCKVININYDYNW